jgi:2-(1,2-epoxy-1,2-dihydrophenyl)acetyl-CoA isomerase
MGYATIVLERAGAVATITLNRPEARNALDLTMRRELTAALDEIEADQTARVLILTGAGGNFCAGGDVRVMKQAERPSAAVRERLEALNRLVVRLFEFPRPTLAMVDGFAVGAGCNLALACDLVVASDRARLGEVFARLGLVPDGGGTWLLPRLCGLARAKQLVFTAEIIGAVEADRLGLVNRVVPAAELAAATRALAETIAAGPPLALRLAKQIMTRAVTTDLRTALEQEAFAQSITADSQDHQEGLRAFSEKRPPRFTGS